ncbi:MAG TPA: GNAT family N-acetyltransferase [Spirochaetota bacterium]|nr:GNAT family N-acetyltransferase [Spirochaetota bacterium]
MRMVYRKATTADVPLLTEYRIRFLDDFGAGKAKQPDDISGLREKISAYFTRTIPSGECVAIIAEDDHTPVGVGLMAVNTIPANYSLPSGRIGSVLNMYTVPSHRRKGVASGIVRTIINEARACGINKLTLNATEAGEKLYRKLGFSDPANPELQLTIKAEE